MTNGSPPSSLSHSLQLKKFASKNSAKILTHTRRGKLALFLGDKNRGSVVHANFIFLSVRVKDKIMKKGGKEQGHNRFVELNIVVSASIYIAMYMVLLGHLN